MTNLDKAEEFFQDYYTKYINDFVGKEILDKNSMDLRSLSELHRAICANKMRIKTLEEEIKNRGRIYIAVYSTLFGVWRYLRDCWHDFWYWFWGLFHNLFESIVKNTYCWKHNEGLYYKNGSIKQYIQKTKRDFRFDKKQQRRGRCH